MFFWSIIGIVGIIGMIFKKKLKFCILSEILSSTMTWIKLAFSGRVACVPFLETTLCLQNY